MDNDRQRDLPMQSRAATVTPATLDAESRTVELVFTTGARVARFDWFEGRFDEELSLDDGDVDLDRLNNGAPLLNAHGFRNLESQIGVVERAWLAKGEGRATVRFSEREDVQPIFADIQAGIIRNVSVGYRVRKYEITREEGQVPVWRAVDWEPMEISMVPIPADAGAGTRAPEEKTFPCIFSQRAPAHRQQETTMSEDTTETAGEASVQTETQTRNTDTAEADMDGASRLNLGVPGRAPSAEDVRTEERTRVRDIMTSGQLLRIPEQRVAEIVASDVTLDQARATMIDEHAAANSSLQIRGVVATPIEGLDETQTRREMMANALMHRCHPGTTTLEDGARQYRGMTLVDMARDYLAQVGVRVRGMPRPQIVSIALNNQRAGGLHGTSDFPAILADVANKTLRAAYDAFPRTFTPWSRRVTAPDFKNINRTQLGEAPQLLVVSESGEFTRGTIGDAKEVYALATYGRVIGITRQAIINDDLDAFTRIPTQFGNAAAMMESDVVWAIITSNPLMHDGKALFHVDHGNLASPGTAPSVDSLGKAREAMRKQVGLDGEQRINVTGRLIMSPAALETKFEQLIAQNLVPRNPTDVVPPFIRSLGLVAEPRLDSASATAWYLSADPGAIDTVEYCFLEGEEGLMIETREGFDIDGVEIKAREDFAAKAIDWRGLYKNPGA